MTLLPAALLLAGAVAFVAARAGTSASIALARRREVLAHPDLRTSHALPTPRLGGIGIAAGIVGGLLALAALGRGMGSDVGGPLLTSLRQFPAGWLLACAGCCAVAFGTGLLDDFHNSPPLAKLAGQALAAGMPAVAGVFPPSVQLSSGAVAVSPFVGGIAVFAFVLLIVNVVNFIDGINGLAGRLCQLGVLVPLVAASPDAPGGLAVIVILFVVLLSIEGFLTLNELRASTFMGDGGSHLLGAVVACAVLLGVSLEPPAGFASIALALPLCIPAFDVLATLARRARRGSRLLSAHREHLYQRHLIATGEDHARTRLFVLAHAGATSGVAVLVVLRDGLEPGVAGVIALGAVLLACGSYWFQVVAAEREDAG